jgi:uncharacterized membrane protein
MISRLNKFFEDINAAKNRKYLLWAILIIFGLLYFSVSYFNHHNLRTFCYDYGVYNQAFYDYAHFRINKNTVFEPPLENFLQIHFSTTLMLLAPFYWVFGWLTGTYTLLFLQAAIILLGGYGVYLLVKLKTQNFVFAVLALLHYLVLWGRLASISADYIDTTIAASLVPFFLYFFEKKNYWAAAAFFFVVLTAKENMPLWLMFICISMAIIHRRDLQQLKRIALFFAFALIYFYAVFAFIIPYFENPDLPYWGFAYGALGNNVKEAFVFILQNPLKVFFLFFENHSGEPYFDGIKEEFYFVFLLSGGIFVFLRPAFLLMFIPIIAQKMLNDKPLIWGINSFYSVEVTAILSIAVFLIIHRIQLKNSLVLAAIVCISALTTTIIKLESRTSKWYEPNKKKESFFDPQMYDPGVDLEKVKKYLTKLPSDAKISASESLVSHLAYRPVIHCFPVVRNAEYIMLLLDHSTYPLPPDQFSAEKNKYISDPEWLPLVDDYPILILKRKIPSIQHQ